MTIMETVICECCGKELPKEEACYIEGGGYYVCPECRENEFTVCDRCGDIIERDSAYQGFDGYLCECCHDDLFG